MAQAELVETSKLRRVPISAEQSSNIDTNRAVPSRCRAPKIGTFSASSTCVTTTQTFTKPLPGHSAPSLNFGVLGTPESRWDINEAAPENFSLLIFYRGLHCPICKTYLQAFDRSFEDFTRLGVEFSALSMDSRERAERAKKQWEIENLPIGYGLGEDTVRQWGLYISESISVDEPRRFSEPGLFLVRPDTTIHYVAINSMPFGRPEPKSVLEAVSYILEKDYPARGELEA